MNLEKESFLEWYPYANKPSITDNVAVLGGGIALRESTLRPDRAYIQNENVTPFQVTSIIAGVVVSAAFPFSPPPIGSVLHIESVVNKTCGSTGAFTVTATNSTTEYTLDGAMPDVTDATVCTIRSGAFTIIPEKPIVHFIIGQANQPVVVEDSQVDTDTSNATITSSAVRSSIGGTPIVNITKVCQYCYF